MKAYWEKFVALVKSAPVVFATGAGIGFVIGLLF